MRTKSGTVSRRVILQSALLATGSVRFASGGTMSSPGAQGGPAQPGLASVKALVFDTFGTVVDWRTSVSGEVAALAQKKGFTIDAAKFADAWRAGYAPSMNRVRKGELPWTTLDRLHRMILEPLLTQFGMSGLSEAEIDGLNRAWHRLRPWPDAVAGLTRLKAKFIIAPLSNGNVSLMTNLAKFGGLPWDCILGAELARHYKPDPEVYQSAADFLDLKPAEVMMVAAHSGDLRAAAEVGLKTAFVVRPQEFGPEGKPDLKPATRVDVSATDFNDLAGQMGA
jgi:2-haloacid dehalogenase